MRIGLPVLTCFLFLGCVSTSKITREPSQTDEPREGEKCYVIVQKDGEVFAAPLKWKGNKDRALYNFTDSDEPKPKFKLERFFVGAIAHEYGDVRSIGFYDQYVGANVSGPWVGEEKRAFFAIYTSKAIAEAKAMDPRKRLERFGPSFDIVREEAYLERWLEMIHTKEFVEADKVQKERLIFQFLLKLMPNGVLVEDRDPKNRDNRAFISCKTFY